MSLYYLTAWISYLNYLKYFLCIKLTFTKMICKTSGCNLFDESSKFIISKSIRYFLVAFWHTFISLSVNKFKFVVHMMRAFLAILTLSWIYLKWSNCLTKGIVSIQLPCKIWIYISKESKNISIIFAGVFFLLKDK